MTMEFRDDRENLINVREERRGQRFEFRDDGDSDSVILEGYAATFSPYDCHGGPEGGGWVEQLSQTSFDHTLSDQPDVQLLINHEGTPLARTKSGTLKLSRDSHGLKVWAKLDKSDPDVQRLIPKMRRKDMDEMSFAFRVTNQTWDTTYTHRTINDLTLEKGDVSVVNYGMNPGTRATISAGAIGALAQLSAGELAEVRSQVDSANLKRAVEVLNTLVRSDDSDKGGKSDNSVPSDDFADPGYKSDGKKRYPVDSAEKVRAAWSYINMPKNHKGYTAEQVSAIKGRIKTAAKKYGVDISDDSGEGKSAASISHIDTVVRADGNTDLVAVMSDGNRVPLPSQRALPGKGESRGDGKFGEGFGDWNPSDSNQDPHDDPFDVGRTGVGGLGPVSSNIVGGSLVSGNGTFTAPGAESDPHDQSLDVEFLAADPHDGAYQEGVGFGGGNIMPMGQGGSMDPHDTPYSVGEQVGPVPGDRPNMGSTGGKVADNITGGTLVGNWPDKGVNPGTAPSVGTAPVAGDARYEWTTGDIEPSAPAEELDAPVGRGISVDPHDGFGSDKLHDGGFHGTPAAGGAAGGSSGSSSNDWSADNIHGTGGGSDVSKATDMDNPNAGQIKLDIGMAQALDRTIVSAYKAATSDEVRKFLVIARRQLTAMRGAQPVNNKKSEVNKKLEELRKEMGSVDTGTVSEGLAFLRSHGNAPIGYRGGLAHDPTLHVVTPAERLARDKAELARRASEECTEAEERLKIARREAQLNDVIRRRLKVER